MTKSPKSKTSRSGSGKKLRLGRGKRDSGALRQRSSVKKH